MHSKSINVGDGTMTIVLSELNQEISSVSNTSGVKGYFVSASFIPKLTKRAAVNYFEHSWYILYYCALVKCCDFYCNLTYDY